MTTDQASIVTVVGARPQFVKAAVVSHALRAAELEERLVHTGQHYDDALSAVFFSELDIPAPAANLGVGSGPHGAQTGAMMAKLEAWLLEHGLPRALVVYGDTNSTLAAALVAAKLHVPLAHVEAGLRSFNRRMPEEVNRVLTDHASDLLFCPTPTAVENLRAEGITEGVHHTGDVMLDATRFYAARAAEQQPLAALTDHAAGTYAVATVHRAENTDDLERLTAIFRGLGRLGVPVLMPLHPRTRVRLGGVAVPPNVELRPPASYLAMLTLVQHACRVLTDSGGLQKEAVWLGVPCITLRDETEWVETLSGGWNRIVGADADRIAEAVSLEPEGPPPGGQAGAAARIADLLASA